MIIKKILFMFSLSFLAITSLNVYAQTPSSTTGEESAQACNGAGECTDGTCCCHISDATHDGDLNSSPTGGDTNGKQGTAN